MSQLNSTSAEAVPSQEPSVADSFQSSAEFDTNPTIQSLFRDAKLEPKANLQSTSAITSSLDSVSIEAGVESTKQVYSPEFLLSLKDSTDIPNMNSKLPDKSFWKLVKRPVANDFKLRKNSFNKQKNHFADSHNPNNRDRKHSHPGTSSFFKNNDIDSLSQDKISQLLGESNEDAIPEWDSADLGGDNFNGLGSMGQTVQDFENWKSQMKKEERKRNGEPLEEAHVNLDGEAEKAGNDVDSFFSFLKPKQNESKDRSGSIGSNSKHEAGRSSKFSSFFAPKETTPASVPPPNLARNNSIDTEKLASRPSQPAPQLNQFQFHQQQLDQPRENLQKQQHIEGQHPFSPNSINNQQPPGLSRFFNSGHENSENFPKARPNPPPGFSQERPEVRRGPPSNHADSFFMSLLNKKEGEGENSASPQKSLNDLFNRPAQTRKPSNGEGVPQVSQQENSSQHHPQFQPGPPGQHNGPPHNQPLPPWMKQFQNGMPPVPPPHMQFPPNFQGNPNFQGGQAIGQPGQSGQPLNGHSINGPPINGQPGQRPPPPGMFPNRMFPNMPPPPGMHMGPYPPPQFMNMPPGLPPQIGKNPNGPNIPPHNPQH